MTNPMKITLEICKFCNCEGCITKVKKAVGDAKLLDMDPKVGKFIIVTTKDPDIIKRAIKISFPKKEIILSHEINDSIRNVHLQVQTPMTIALQIDPFCDCKGCVDKVKKALGKLDDVKLLEMDPNKGLFMILTTRDPDAIKCAVKSTFPKKNIICVHLQDAPPPPPPQTNITVTPSAPPIPQIQIWQRDTFQGTVKGFFENGRLDIYDV